MTNAVNTLSARRARALGPGYRLFYEQPLHIVRGDGVFLYDSEDNEYLDAYNNVPCVGHSNERVVRAITNQVSVLNTHTRYLHESIVTYTEKLLATTDGTFDHVIYTCSGSEAIDLALRLSSTHSRSTGVVVTENAYHGTTTRVSQVSPSMGSATPLGTDVRLASVPNVFSGTPNIASELADNVSGAIQKLHRHGIGFSSFLVDTVFSSDGLIVEEPGFLTETFDVVKAAGGLFIADEVQAGFGRTGTMWGYARHGIDPDIVVLGKPMGNGMPIGAVMVKKEVLDLFEGGADYFNTFGGNPVSIAAANAVLDELLTPEFLPEVDATGQTLMHELSALARTSPILGRIRGAGLFISVDTQAYGGVSSKEICDLFIEALKREKILIGSCGLNRDILKIRPPLVFREQHISRFVDGFASAHDALIQSLS